MPPDDVPHRSPEPLAYETPLPKAFRAVTIPSGLFALHRFLLGTSDVLTIVYGILLLSVKWLFKACGVVFVVPSKRRSASKDP